MNIVIATKYWTDTVWSLKVLLVGWIVSHPIQKFLDPEPVNVTLLGKRVFADIIKDILNWSIADTQYYIAFKYTT